MGAQYDNGKFPYSIRDLSTNYLELDCSHGPAYYSEPATKHFEYLLDSCLNLGINLDTRGRRKVSYCPFCFELYLNTRHTSILVIE